MIDLFTLYAAEVLLTAALAGLALRCAASALVRLLALALGAAVMVVSWLALTDLLSRPKPIALENRPVVLREAVVISGDIVENQAIHLWLRLPELEEPRAFTLPWDRRRAEELETALGRAGREGGRVRLIWPGRDPTELEPMFHPEPPPPLPPKTAVVPASVPGTAVLPVARYTSG
ncbi:MAG: hypothetical protein AB7I59_02725 [Geminicoccaceae bacterium]